VGKLIGSIVAKRYRVDALIGSGGMADVYRGVDVLLGRPVAVKTFTDRAASVRKRYLREAQAMARLNHRNIVLVYDAGETNDVAFIVMELLEGTPLRDLINGPLPIEAAVRYSVELLEALSCAHAQGVVHCDVKPTNVMLLADGSIKVMDFGLSRRATDYADGVAAGEIVGTVAYLPPERFLGKPVGPRSDLYSVGVMMYEMLTGTVPFKNDNEDLVAIVFSHVNELPLSPRALNAKIPPELERVVLKLLEKDPDKRYSSADAALEALRPFRAAALPASRGHDGAPAQAADGIDDQVRGLLDKAFGRNRRANEASSHVLAGMIASQRREYEEAIRRYLTALTALKGNIESELEYAKTALKFAMLILQKNSAGRADRGEIGVAIATLQDALPILRGSRLMPDLEEGERTLYALNRLDVSLRV
jgi:serine/threonine protein kinase